MKKPQDDRLPAPSTYDENGYPLYALDDLMKHWQLSEQEKQRLADIARDPTEPLVAHILALKKSALH